MVVGGGPCGLACARRLLQLGHHDVVLLEAADTPGGLASSIVDPAGFTWDRGGHVVFSHYGEFDRLLDQVMGTDVEHHERSSFVHVAGTWVPYPMQNNLHRLPAHMAEAALTGLIAAQHAPRPAGDPDDVDFGTWMSRTFGDGIVEQFMRPYNEKVWAQPPSAMSSRWIAERVSTVDWRQALRAVVRNEDDVTWGPNNMFAFPVPGRHGRDLPASGRAHRRPHPLRDVGVVGRPEPPRGVPGRRHRPRLRAPGVDGAARSAGRRR